MSRTASALASLIHDHLTPARPIDLSGQDLAGYDLRHFSGLRVIARGCDLRGVNVAGVDLRGWDISGSDARGIHADIRTRVAGLKVQDTAFGGGELDRARGAGELVGRPRMEPRGYTLDHEHVAVPRQPDAVAKARQRFDAESDRIRHQYMLNDAPGYVPAAAPPPFAATRPRRDDRPRRKARTL